MQFMMHNQTDHCLFICICETSMVTHEVGVWQWQVKNYVKCIRSEVVSRQGHRPFWTWLQRKNIIWLLLTTVENTVSQENCQWCKKKRLKTCAWYQRASKPTVEKHVWQHTCVQGGDRAVFSQMHSCLKTQSITIHYEPLVFPLPS